MKSRRGLMIALGLLLSSGVGVSFGETGNNQGEKSVYAFSISQFQEYERTLDSVAKETSREKQIDLLRKLEDKAPDDPLNIRLDFKIGELMAQSYDSNGGPPADPAAAVSIFRQIVTKYDHKRYYKPPGFLDESDSPEWLVPRAAILEASILIGERRDQEQARVELKVAMDDIAWTVAKRKDEWTNAPMPIAKPLPYPDPYGKITEETVAAERKKEWQERKDRAKTDEVLTPFEMTIVAAAVRQYGLSFGPQRVDQVAATMDHLLRDYPETPLAAIARTHIEAANRILDEQSQRTPERTPQGALAVQEQPGVPKNEVSIWRRTSLVVIAAGSLGIIVATILYFKRRGRRSRS